MLTLISATLLLATSSFAGVKILLPSESFQLTSEKAFSAIVDEYNQTHPTQAVEIIRKGGAHSSLKELIALHLAGTPPDLAAIEASELPTIEKLGALIPIPPEEWKALTSGMRKEDLEHTQSSAGARLAIPFQRTAAVLVADEEVLFRLRLTPARAPTTWEDLHRTAIKVAELIPPNSKQVALSLPLQGPRGLWLFESLTHSPLWKRQPGGLKSTRALVGSVQTLRAWMDHPKLSREADAWDRGLQDFIDRKVALLLTSTESLPLISAQAGFRWGVAPAPQIESGKTAPHPRHSQPMIGGSNWVAMRNSPEVWRFLRYLYSDPVARRWTLAGGFVPLKPGWLSPETPASYRNLIQTLRPTRPRVTDPDAVRARGAWVQGLVRFFGEKGQRLGPEDVLDQLDRSMNLKGVSD